MGTIVYMPLGLQQLHKTCNMGVSILWCSVACLSYSMDLGGHGVHRTLNLPSSCFHLFFFLFNQVIKLSPPLYPSFR